MKRIKVIIMFFCILLAELIFSTYDYIGENYPILLNVVRNVMILGLVFTAFSILMSILLIDNDSGGCG